MRVDCPHDRPGRTLDDQARLTCGVKDCRCVECQRALSERERKDWVGEP
jgi:hypothetical protein